MQRLEKSDRVVIRGSNGQDFHSESGELFGWESMVLHEDYE